MNFKEAIEQSKEGYPPIFYDRYYNRMYVTMNGEGNLLYHNTPFDDLNGVKLDDTDMGKFLNDLHHIESSKPVESENIPFMFFAD